MPEDAEPFLPTQATDMARGRFCTVSGFPCHDVPGDQLGFGGAALELDTNPSGAMVGCMSRWDAREQGSTDGR